MIDPGLSTWPEEWQQWVDVLENPEIT